jgi:hypothetical protein
MGGLVLYNFPGLGGVQLDQIPDFAFRITEPGECAQVLLVGEPYRGTINRFGLLRVRLMAGRFRAVEMNLRVEPSQKGLLADWPQRQRAYCGVAENFFPSRYSSESPSVLVTIHRSLKGRPPLTRYGPSLVTSICGWVWALFFMTDLP